MISRELAIKRAVAAGKTVVMKQADFDRWIEALRSGEYKQAQKRLSNDTATAFCCLGVEQVVRMDHVETVDGLPQAVPSLEYLNANDVIYLYATAETTNPSLATRSAASMNDNGVSFNEIADALENAFMPWPEE